MYLANEENWTNDAFADSVAMQSEAASVGFDWPTIDGVLDKAREELDELSGALSAGDTAGINHELGDILLILINLSRKLEIDPSAALRDANARFRERFVRMRSAIEGNGERIEDLSLDALNLAWEQVKDVLYREQKKGLT